MILRVAIYLISVLVGTAGGLWGVSAVETDPLLAPPVVAKPAPIAVNTSVPLVIATTSVPSAFDIFPAAPPLSPTIPLPSAVPAPQEWQTSSAAATVETGYTPSVAGIIAATNYQRSAHNITPFLVDERLTSMAKAKVNDMFAKQYFAHDSPTGGTVAELAMDAGYEYLLVGENLALGSFRSSKAIVDAWMASPGHRENVLKESYTQIGVAVVKGRYEGKTVWIAVQEFGLPASACREPDPMVAELIAGKETTLETLGKKVRTLRNALDDGSRTSNEINAYNTAVASYNRFLEDYRGEVEKYNRSVSIYYDCIDAVAGR